VSRAARVAALGLAVFGVACLLLTLGATSILGAFGDGRRGPRGSSFARGPEGLSDYAAALRAGGREVIQRRRALDVDTSLDPADVVVVLDAPRLAPEEGLALRRFVSAGGRAVVGGEDPARWLPLLLDDAPRWTPGGQVACHSVLAVPEARGVTDVVLSGAGRWADPGATLPFLSCRGAVSATVASPAGAAARGRVVLLADSGPLQNRYLTARDDRALGLAVVGDRRRVVFAEQVHGFGSPAGVAALPRRLRTALLLALLAGLLALAARASRPRSSAADPPAGAPPRLAFAEATARRLARGGHPDEAAVPLQRAARAALARAAGLPTAAELDEAALRAAGSQVGLEPAQVEALLRPARSDGDMVAAGRALATLSPARVNHPTADTP